jgi:DUF4097 and DUF4098 domain-containing protein YvlB
MTIHKPCAAFLLLVAGAIPVGLSGCRNTGAPYSGKPEIATSDSGAVSISRMGGEIDVDDAPHGASLSTMGGDIHVKSVASFAHLKTMGGNIDIDNANASVDAVSMGGNIVIDKANGAVKASTNGGNVTVHLVAGADDPSSGQRHDVELISNGGNIELTVPKNFPMDVQVTLAYTKSATRAYRIEDNIGLTQHTSKDWDDSAGTPRKYIRAQGIAGNGSNHVVIKTINGDVIVRSE